MRFKFQRFWGLFFLALLCACLLMLCWHKAESRRADQLYQEAAKLVSLPSSTHNAVEATPVRTGLDLSKLREVNADVVCWIEIPGAFSYPVLQGEDNAYYLSHTWDGEKNPSGSIFLDYRASTNLADFHTLLYGHRMQGGSMFGSLKQYSDAGFWQLHPSIYLSDEEGTRQYAIFAAYEVGLTEIVYRQDLSKEDRQELIQYGLNHSVIETGIVPTSTDTIITLSTCTGRGYDARWVVQAVQCREK